MNPANACLIGANKILDWRQPRVPPIDALGGGLCRHLCADGAKFMTRPKTRPVGNQSQLALAMEKEAGFRFNNINRFLTKLLEEDFFWSDFGFFPTVLPFVAIGGLIFEFNLKKIENVRRAVGGPPGDILVKPTTMPGMAARLAP